MRKYATKPTPKTAKLVLTTCAACFARQNPVSTSAKPACMKMTSTAPITTHNKLMGIERSGAGVCPASWASAGAAVQEHERSHHPQLASPYFRNRMLAPPDAVKLTSV